MRRRGTPDNPLSPGEIVFRCVRFILDTTVKINALAFDELEPELTGELEARLRRLAEIADAKADELAAARPP